MSQNTPPPVQGPTIQSFLSELEKTKVTIGQFGGRKFTYGGTTLSLNAIVKKCLEFCQSAKAGTVSPEQLHALKDRIKQLDVEGQKALAQASRFQKVLTYLSRIGNIRFLFKSPVAQAEKSLEDLTEKIYIDQIVLKLSEKQEPDEIRKFITSLKLPPEQLATVRTLAIREFFKPFNLTKSFPKDISSLQEELEHKMSLLSHFDYLESCFRPEGMAEGLAPYKDSIIKNLSSIMGAWIKEFDKNESSELFNLLYDKLQNYHNKIASFFPDFSKQSAWDPIQKKLERRYQELFSKPRTFCMQTHAFKPEYLPITLEKSDRPEKDQINKWLVSLPEAWRVATDINRELSNGVFIDNKEEYDQEKIKASKQKITRDSLNQELNVTETEDDKRVVLSWGLYQKLISYLQQNKVPNPEKSASNLLLLSTQQFPYIYTCFTSLGRITGHNVMPSGTEVRKYNYLCDPSPSVRIQFVYEEYDEHIQPTGKKFLVTDTIHVQPDKGTFTEDVTCTPYPQT